MSDINFLPLGFVSRRAKRRRIVREVALVATVALGIPLWVWSRRDDLTSLETYAASLDAQVVAAGEQLGEMTKLSAEQRSLLGHSRTQRELAASLPMHVAIASLGSLMPPGVAVRDLSVVGESPRPAPPAPPGAPAAPAGAVPPGPLKVTLVGLAPADGEVAEYVARLAESPLCGNVKLAYSRSTVYRDLIAREFRIELEIPLDRDYRRPPGAAADSSREVARAD